MKHLVIMGLLWAAALAVQAQTPKPSYKSENTTVSRSRAASAPIKPRGLRITDKDEDYKRMTRAYAVIDRKDQPTDLVLAKRELNSINFEIHDLKYQLEKIEKSQKELLTTAEDQRSKAAVLATQEKTIDTKSQSTAYSRFSGSGYRYGDDSVYVTGSSVSNRMTDTVTRITDPKEEAKVYVESARTQVMQANGLEAEKRKLEAILMERLQRRADLLAFIKSNETQPTLVKQNRDDVKTTTTLLSLK